MNNVLTLEEAAAYLKVHPSTIYRLVKNRQIPAFKVGFDWRFNLDSIDRWINESEIAVAEINQSKKGAPLSPKTGESLDIAR